MTTKDTMKAGAYTALWAFIALFGLSLAGWLSDLYQWASSSGREPLPGLSVLGYALVAAIASSVAGLVTFIVRFAQSKNVLPGSGPTYKAT